MFTFLNLCLAAASHYSKWVKITDISWILDQKFSINTHFIHNICDMISL